MGMMLSAPAGNDILFDESLCEQGRNFNNKIWNCFRLVKGWEVADKPQGDNEALAVRWFSSLLAKTAAEIADLFKKYRLSEALMAIYKLYCDEFSGWYLEMIKPAYGQPIDRTTYEATLSFFDQMLRLLHPFMPFITEELWQNLTERKAGESIMVTPLGKFGTADEALLADIETLKQVVSNVRNIRAGKNIPQKEVLTLNTAAATPSASGSLIEKLANCQIVYGVSEKATGSASFIIGTTEYSVPLDKFINVEDEIKKLEADLQHQEGFLRGVMAKLGNERFVANAKPEVVELERKKKADAEARIASIQESLAALRGSH